MDDEKLVVLEVKEGRGFDSFQNNIILRAELDNTSLKTKGAHRNRVGNVYFHEKLLWKIQKKHLKRLKISSTPIKIECYEVDNYGNKIRIGYQSIKLKSIKGSQTGSDIFIGQVVLKELCMYRLRYLDHLQMNVFPYSHLDVVLIDPILNQPEAQPNCFTLHEPSGIMFPDDVEGEWMKLLGVSCESRQSGPSVLLKLYILESLANEGDIEREYPEVASVLTSTKGFIEIGPVDDHTDIFSLGIKPTKMENLNLLLPERPANDDECFIIYNLLGYEILSDQILNLSFPSQQNKMIIPIKTTINTFKFYLEKKPYLSLSLVCGEKEIGFTQADLRMLLPEDGVSALPSSIESHSLLQSREKELSLEKGQIPYIDILLTLDLLKKDNLSNDPQMLMSERGDNLSLGIVEELNNDVPVMKHPEDFSSTSIHQKKITSEKCSTDNDQALSRAQESVSKSGKSSPRPHSDEELIFKVVQELEEWKEIQKEMFIDKMKRKEKQHLDLLSSEWHLKRDRLETNLTKVIAQNHTLMDSLKSAISDLQEHKNKVANEEKQLKYLKDDLERRYHLKLQDLQTASKRMEEDSIHKVTILDEQIRELQRENINLKRKIREQDIELSKLVKGSPSKDQTVCLLSEVKSLREELEAAEKSKAYFKNQWAKTMREMHRMKTEIQESLQTQIKHNKEELRQFGLLLKTPKFENTVDNEEPRLPEHIQKIIDKRNEMNECKDDVESTSSKIQFPEAHQSLMSKDSIKGDKIQRLIEERNDLLRSGSYTTDDKVVLGLNEQIRSLMTSCGNSV